MCVLLALNISFHCCVQVNNFTQRKMIIQVHFKRDFTRTNILPALGFEPMTFRLMLSWQGITLLWGLAFLRSITSSRALPQLNEKYFFSSRFVWWWMINDNKIIGDYIERKSLKNHFLFSQCLCAWLDAHAPTHTHPHSKAHTQKHTHKCTHTHKKAHKSTHQQYQNTNAHSLATLTRTPVHTHQMHINTPKLIPHSQTLTLVYQRTSFPSNSATLQLSMSFFLSPTFPVTIGGKSGQACSENA